MSRFRFDKHRLEAFDKDVQAVCEKYTIHPAILFFQPDNSMEQFILWIGSPAIEWISEAGQSYMTKLAIESPLWDNK
jgi:hypothetical protein